MVCGVLRGDSNGKFSNQDRVIGHLADDHPLVVGQYVTVGHGAVFHACEVKDECNHYELAILTANWPVIHRCRQWFVPAGMQVPEGSLVAGVPAKVKGSLTQEERDKLKGWANIYWWLKPTGRNLGK